MVFNYYKENENINCGGHGTIEEFLDTRKEIFIPRLDNYVTKGLNLPVKEEQKSAWEDCYLFLKNQLKELTNINSSYKNIHIVFEYKLPLEAGRRPDVILLAKNRLIVLEFKMKKEWNYNDIEQTINYKRDIQNYHNVTNKFYSIQDINDQEKNNKIKGYLVLTDNFAKKDEQDNIKILSSDSFNDELNKLNLNGFDKNINKWLESKYVPLPNIVKSAQDLFEYGELPDIKNIKDSDIEKTYKYINKISIENKNKNKNKNIIFVTGVPGSGKTLIALRLVYNYNKQFDNKAYYLSGNGPLIKLLNYSLKSPYIKGMINFKKEYKSKFLNRDLIIFDEAQRAWDSKQMKKYGSDFSEPEFIINVMNKSFNNQNRGLKNTTLVCFMGDGQHIYKGEEGGLSLWAEALRKNQDWNIYAPEEYEDKLDVENNKIFSNYFALDTSLRDNFVDTTEWRESILSCNLQASKKNIKNIYNQGYTIRVSRDSENIYNLLKDKEIEDPSVKYGLIKSSYTKNKDVFNNSQIRNLNNKDVNDVGRWFNGDCNNLNCVATEFDCQGLELDYPIITFGGEYYYNNKKWNIETEVKENHVNEYENFNVIMKNIYRVLLSRGRKGIIMYLPKLKELDETYNFLLESGVRKI